MQFAQHIADEDCHYQSKIARIFYEKIVKTVLLACLVILPLFALSACSSRSHFATQKDQWQTYTKEKKIKIGFDATFVPMGYEEKDGSYIGFDIDLANADFLNYMALMLNGKLLTGI